MRDESRLLVYHRASGEMEHRIFRDVIDYLNPGDALVINETRVLPARLIGEREDTGGAMEFLLLRRVNYDSLGDAGQARQARKDRRHLLLWRGQAARHRPFLHGGRRAPGAVPLRRRL